MYKTEEWKRLFLDQKESGKNVHQYCKDKGINEKTFYSNRKKMENLEVIFKPVQIESPQIHMKVYDIPVEIPFDDLMKVIKAWRTL